MPRLWSALFFALVRVGSAGAVDGSSLALTPLPRSAFGPQAGALPLDPDSGVAAAS